MQAHRCVEMPWRSPINPLLPGGDSLYMLARERRRKTLNSNHLLPSGLALSGKGKSQPLGPCCIAWRRSQARINGKGCGRKGIRHKNFASKPINMADTDLDPTGASPSSDAQEHRRALARNGLRLPYHERIRLKKIAQRRRRRDKEGKGKTIRIATLNVGSMTGRGQEVVDFMERRKINIMCVQETKLKGSKARELGNGF